MHDMDETETGEGSTEALHPHTTLWAEECGDKLRSINLGSRDSTPTSTSFGSSIEHERQDSVSQRVSQSLWASGKLSEPIPDGFYFVTPGRRFKELFDTLPTLECLASFDLDGLRPSVILVDSQKDKKLDMLKQLTLSLVKGMGSNPNAMIKKIAGLVCDVYKSPNMKGNQVKDGLEEISHAFGNQGVHLLGQIKHGSCHSKSILFKVLADVAGLDSRLIVGLPKEGLMDQTDSYKHISTTVFVNSVEMLVDLVHSPGKLVPCSMKTIFLSHISSIADSDSVGYDSYDSPIEPNSPSCIFGDHVDFESTDYEGTSPLDHYKLEGSSNMFGRSLRSIALRSRATTEQKYGLSSLSPRSEPNVANSFWPRSSKKVVGDPGTSMLSPEYPSSRKVGRSLLGSKRHSFREYTVDLTTSRSVGASPTEAIRRRRSCGMVPEIGDDIVRAVRSMNASLKQCRRPKEELDETLSCNTSEPDSLDLQEYVSEFHKDDHDSLYGEKLAAYNFLRKKPGQQRAMSMPSSPHFLGNRGKEAEKVLGLCNTISSLDKVLESRILSKPLLPFQEWNIDISEISVGIRVGIGSFGEVFCGVWNGINVAIKVFLEQDLTVDNVEDFCNEISILGRVRHPNGNLSSDHLIKMFRNLSSFKIVTYSTNIKPPRLSIVTEYMEMGSLYYLIHVSGQKKRMKWKRRLKMLCDICRGLMCIHRMNIAHRDLKSANCLVNKHWKVKICDFGLSRVLTKGPVQDSSSAGTPQWMAPELIRNEPFTEKCDIFSLGVIIWELYTLRKPWEGMPSSQVVYAVAYNGKRLEVPEGPLGELISDCWAEAQDRPNCHQILSRLIECQSFLYSNEGGLG